MVIVIAISAFAIVVVGAIPVVVVVVVGARTIRGRLAVM